MSSKKRNVRYFSKMKVRGAKNRRFEGLYRLAGSFDRLEQTSARAAKSMVNLGKALS